jgi:tRNA dimethylallyltransferase
MDIGTAKPDLALQALVPHRLIDIRDPTESYSVAEFLRDVHREITAIVAAGRVPLLVGGTMHYFRALLDGLADLPPACPEFRQRLAEEAGGKGWPYLHARLAQVDPDTASSLHPNHSQRIQRALEVFELTGVPLSVAQRQPLAAGRGTSPLTDSYQVLQLVLMPDDRQLLHQRIESRLSRMMELGFLKEVQRLYERGDLTTDMPALRAVGYRQAWGFLAREFDAEEMMARALAATRQLGKRQCTWLRSWRKDDHVQLQHPVGGGISEREVLVNTLKFLNKNGIDC